MLGRVTEAEREFRVALSINPSHYSAEFNLGERCRRLVLSLNGLHYNLYYAEITRFAVVWCGMLC